MNRLGNECIIVEPNVLDLVLPRGRFSLRGADLESRDSGLSLFLAARPLACLLPLLSLLFSLAVVAQQGISNAPIHEVDGSFLKEWLVLGPVPFSKRDTELLEQSVGEANVRPKEGDVVMTADGTRLTWTRLRSRTDMVQIQQAINTNEGFVAYAYCELSSPQPIESDLRIYSTEGVAVWFNGAEIGAVSFNGETNLDFPPTLPIKIEEGRNPFLLKFKHHVPELRFMIQALPPQRIKLDLNIIDLAGNPVTRALVQFYDHGE